MVLTPLMLQTERMMLALWQTAVVNLGLSPPESTHHQWPAQNNVRSEVPTLMLFITPRTRGVSLGGTPLSAMVAPAKAACT